MKKLILMILSARLGVAWNSVGTRPNGLLSRACDEAVTTRHLLMSQGAAADTVQIAAAGERPLGVMMDEVDATDVSTATPKNVALLGAVPGTVKMVAGSSFSANVLVYSIGNGKVDVVGDAATGDWRVGLAITAAGAADAIVEVIPELPTVVK